MAIAQANLWRPLLRPALMALTVTAVLATSVSAQETPRPEESKAGYFRRTADGTLIPLSEFGLRDADVEALIRQKEDRLAPQFEVSRVVLDGHVDGALAWIDATLTVRLNVDEKWVSVPLLLDDGKLTAAPKYAGNGRATFDAKTTRESGSRHWLFYGAGEHQLTLPLVVPVREPQHLRSSMRLILPPAVASQLTLRVPAPSVIAQAPRDSGFRTTREGQGTIIEVFGLGTQFALQWETRPDVAGSRPFLRSRTTFSVNLTTDPFSISARQSLEMQQGSVGHVDITIPEGLVLRRTEPQAIDPGGHIRKVEFDEDIGRVRLTFTEPLTDRVDLQWDLAAQDSGLARIWTFTGFLVTGAQEQTTDLELTPPEGVAVQELKSVGIQKQLRPSRSDPRSVTRVRLLDPESQFTVQLRDVEPFYTVSPVMVLLAGENQLRLEARFRIRVLRGSLQQVTLRWPGLEAEEWKLLPPITGDGLSEWTSDDEPQADSVRLNLLSRMAGTFEVGVGAVRVHGDSQTFPVSLPRIEAQTRQPTSFVLCSERNVQIQLHELDGTESVPIPVDPRLLADFDTPTEQLNREARLIRSDERRFEAAVQTRERSLHTDTTLALRVGSSAVDVDQSLKYHVEFDHISELRLNVPAGIDPEVSLDDGSVLRRIDVGELTARYPLPVPVTGDILVHVRYRIPIDAAASRFILPLVRSADTRFTETRLGILPDAALAVTPAGKWTPAFSRSFESEWRTSDELTQITLNFAGPLGQLARRFAVPRALLQTKVAGNIAETRANFVIQGKFTRQILQVPDGTQISAVAWNGQSLAPDLWAVDRLVDTKVLTIRQSQSGGSGILSVDFRTPTDSLSLTRRVRLQAPMMPEGTPVDEVLWQVILPAGEHLADYDSGSIPCFRWKFGRFGWRREPPPDFANLEEWLGLDQARAARVIRTAVGNAYTFERPNLNLPLRVSTMDQSFALLLGSGLALVLAFSLTRLTPRRFAVAIPGLAVLLSLVSLRYATTIELLLQPFAIGIVLALVAWWLDRRRYRRGYGLYGVDAPTRATSVAIEITPSSHQGLPAGSGP